MFFKFQKIEPKRVSILSVCFFFFHFLSVHKPSKCVANVKIMLKNAKKFV